MKTEKNISGIAKATLVSLCATAVMLLQPAPAYSQDCEIQKSVTRVGSKRNPRSVTIPEMSQITNVQLTRTRGGWSLCPTSAFSFTDNILAVLPGCRGDFLVTGVKEGCATASGKISQVPLFLTQQSEPNIMFILDDSGSMHWELMPDSLVSIDGKRVAYLFPRANGIYGERDYKNTVATVEPVAYNAVARSPQQNAIYYNPSVTYLPWIRSDGSVYPNAEPLCALHNPERPVPGLLNSFDQAYCRNLAVPNRRYNSNEWANCTYEEEWEDGVLEEVETDCDTDKDERLFWPALYFWHDGGEVWNYNNYQRVEIRPTQSLYTGHDREFRTDCLRADDGICTYAEEIQNFANWYTYYRSRTLAARAGVGYAFSQQGSGMRVGFASMNQDENNVDGVVTEVVDDGVRVFKGSSRDKFYETLYTRPNPAAGTPARFALDKVGAYFQRKDNKGPYGLIPGTDDKTEHMACRRNYAILMTDGYYSGGGSGDADNSNARKNVDGTIGPRHTSWEGEQYQYTPATPFADDRDETLADVAMYYWVNDLRPDLENKVATTKRNPAFWQHMTTFGIGLGVEGNVPTKTGLAAIESGAAINWPDPESDKGSCKGATCPARIDDLLHAAVNSRGGFFSAADPNQFAADLARVLNAISVETDASAAAVSTNSTRLDSGTLLFQAGFDTRDWSGSLKALGVNPDGSLAGIKWSTDNTVKFSSWQSRNIFTAVDTGTPVKTQSVDFKPSEWDKLSDAQRSALRSGQSETDGKNVMNWIRGDQTNENDTGLGYRIRSRLLGDIVNSDPFFVGNSEDFGYTILPGTEGDTYRNFLISDSGKKKRRNMIYVGGNDGMLHGFDAETGKEIFGFIPAGIYDNLFFLAQNGYSHRYFVDGSMRVKDVYLSNSWRSVLVGSTGAGGRSVFALDVTDPDAMGPSKFLWEFTTGPLAVDKLGVAMSDPTIIRVKAGNRWLAIFGNGYDSGDNVKLMLVDLEDGTLVRSIDTGVSGVGNGLSTVVPVDTNDDRISDYVYAGDLQGNLWKFDLTGNTPLQWGVAFKQGLTPEPLFKAVDRDGKPQPITARPVIGRHEEGGLMIYFGTGKFFETGDEIIPANPQVNTFYGIRDEDKQVQRSDLLEQTIIYEGGGKLQNKVGDSSDDTPTDQPVRLVTNNGFGTPTDHGWRLDLIPPARAQGTGEQVTSRALVRDGRIIFTTNIPDPDPCGYGGTGWLMELDAATGSRLDFSAFDLNDDSEFTEGDYVEFNGQFIPVSGLGEDQLIRTPGIVGAGKQEYKYVSGSSGSISITREKGTGSSLGRQSWRQVR